QGIFGHSMGGHGALTIGLKNPDTYRSMSAFAPISSPMNCPWGHKALSHYLGEDRSTWHEYDAVELVKGLDKVPAHPVLVDQGMADQFLAEQLNPDLLETACRDRGVELDLRRHDGYDHGYYFITTFMEEHLRHHARILT
ncbi:MAG: alpha/beta hydrolase-fold protein, partial [Woeseia sp.]